MPLFRQTSANQFVPFITTDFTDLEKDLETWIAANPMLLGTDSSLAIFSRQPRTAHGKLADLLAVDESGAVVVIELKRGETPREVIAQALEYAAWVDTLSVDDLDRLAGEFALKTGLAAGTLADIYRQVFAHGSDDVDGSSGIVDNITFNHRQRLIIVAEHFAPEVEETLRYLRTKHGLDVSGVRFGIHKAGDELIIQTELLVGRERTKDVKETQIKSREAELDESILERVQTEFMREAVTAIEEWVDHADTTGIEVRHGARSDHFIHIHGIRHVVYYYARNWINGYLLRPTDGEIERLQLGLSKPDQVSRSEREDHVRFHLATHNDLLILQDVLLRRLKA